MALVFARGWIRWRSLGLVAWLGLAYGCGNTQGGAPEAHGGTAGANAAGASAAGGANAAGAAQAALPTPTCDDPVPVFGSCYSGAQCAQGVNEFAANVTASICLPGLGLTPDPQPCTDFQLLGRCFEPDPGVWRSHYDDGSGASQLKDLKASCDEMHGVWCTNPATVPTKLAAQCVAACKAAQPNYAGAPECLMANDCNAQCWHQLTAPTQACADCVTAALTWPPGGCGSFECSCPPPSFGDCDAACGK